LPLFEGYVLTPFSKTCCADDEVFIEATWKKFSPNVTEEKAGNKSLSSRAGGTPVDKGNGMK
jgi:hypothetical protein